MNQQVELARLMTVAVLTAAYVMVLIWGVRQNKDFLVNVATPVYLATALMVIWTQ